MPLGNHETENNNSNITVKNTLIKVDLHISNFLKFNSNETIIIKDISGNNNTYTLTKDGLKMAYDEIKTIYEKLFEINFIDRISDPI